MIQSTNIRRILDRVMRHPMMRDIPFETAVEYTVDFISLMGTPAIYDEKTAIVNVNDWRGQLPCDFVKMQQVRVAPCQHVNRWSNCGILPIGTTYRYSGHSFHMSDYKPNTLLTSELTYMLQGMVIFTSTKDIDVEIAYTAFAVDDEGYPLLPDNASFLRGLENYIKLQWFTILFDTGKISHQVMFNAQQEYAWAAGDAQSEFSRLSLDEAETLFNSFKTLLSRNYEHSKGFITNGSKEVFLHAGSLPSGSGIYTNNGTGCSGGGVHIIRKSSTSNINPSSDPSPSPSPSPDVTPSVPVFVFSNNVVAITCSTTGATIYYREQGDSAWITYSSPVAIIADTEFQAYSSLNGVSSQVVTYSATYDDGGSEPEPTRRLAYPMYYGGLPDELELNSSTALVVSTFSNTNTYVTSNIYCEGSYFYFALADIYTISSIIAPSTTENVTDSFPLKGTYSQNGIVYKLYEFHLRSGLSYDQNITVTVTD